MSIKLCKNNISILLLLSEEIFDYGKHNLTSEIQLQMKKSLNSEFQMVFELCMFILNNSKDVELLLNTLKTLSVFLRWIPIGYVYETKLIDILADKFFPADLFQLETLKCLTEIVSIPLKGLSNEIIYQEKIIILFQAITSHVYSMLYVSPSPNQIEAGKNGSQAGPTPHQQLPTTPHQILHSVRDLNQIYYTSNNKVQTFIQLLALFFSTFLTNTKNIQILELNKNYHMLYYQSLAIILEISKIQNKRVIFKITLDFWKWIVNDLYNSTQLQQKKINKKRVKMI